MLSDVSYQNSVIKENTMSVVQVQKCSQSQTPVISYRSATGEPCIPNSTTVGRIEEVRPPKEFTVVQSTYTNHPKIINSMKNIVLENTPQHKPMLGGAGDYFQQPHHLQYPKGPVVFVQKSGDDCVRYSHPTPSSPNTNHLQQHQQQQQTVHHMLTGASPVPTHHHQAVPSSPVKPPLIMDNSVASSSKGEPDLNIGNV